MSTYPFEVHKASENAKLAHDSIVSGRLDWREVAEYMITRNQATDSLLEDVAIVLKAGGQLKSGAHIAICNVSDLISCEGVSLHIFLFGIYPMICLLPHPNNPRIFVDSISYSMKRAHSGFLVAPGPWLSLMYWEFHHAWESAVGYNPERYISLVEGLGMETTAAFFASVVYGDE